MKTSAAALLLCICADAVVAGADVLAKKWVQGWGIGYFWSAYALYLAVTGLWFVLLKMVGDLGRSSVVWAATGVIAGLVIGAVMGEKLSPLNWVGIVMAVLGVALTAVK